MSDQSHRLRLLLMLMLFTFQDKYILGSMAILATICVWHAFIPFVSSTILPCQPDRVAQADMIAFGILATIYVAFHLGLLCAIACLVSTTQSSLSLPLSLSSS